MTQKLCPKQPHCNIMERQRKPYDQRQSTKFDCVYCAIFQIENARDLQRKNDREDWRMKLSFESRKNVFGSGNWEKLYHVNVGSVTINWKVTAVRVNSRRWFGMCVEYYVWLYSDSRHSRDSPLEHSQIIFNFSINCYLTFVSLRYISSSTYFNVRFCFIARASDAATSCGRIPTRALVLAFRYFFSPMNMIVSNCFSICEYIFPIKYLPWTSGSWETRVPLPSFGIRKMFVRIRCCACSLATLFSFDCIEQPLGIFFLFQRCCFRFGFLFV